VSRGQVIYKRYETTTNDILKPLESNILKRVSPGGRLLAFYVDKKTSKLVADASKFEVEPTCLSEEVYFGIMVSETCVLCFKIIMHAYRVEV